MTIIEYVKLRCTLPLFSHFGFQLQLWNKINFLIRQIWISITFHKCHVVQHKCTLQNDQSDSIPLGFSIYLTYELPNSLQKHILRRIQVINVTKITFLLRFNFNEEEIAHFLRILHINHILIRYFERCIIYQKYKLFSQYSHSARKNQVEWIMYCLIKKDFLILIYYHYRYYYFPAKCN